MKKRVFSFQFSVFSRRNPALQVLSVDFRVFRGCPSRKESRR